MKSLNEIEPDRAIFFTDIEFECPFFEVIQIPKIKNKDEYSEFIIDHLHRYFNTTHVLIVQWDSAVLDANEWSDTFLDYDVIGSSWAYNDDYNCGNGGFSLRSKKLMEHLAKDPQIVIKSPEDECIGRLYGRYLRGLGFKFAPKEVMNKFAYEMVAPDRPTFGHHQYYHESFIKPVVLKRAGALGDIIMLEPVMEWFTKKGLRVYLDIPQNLMTLFQYLPYRVRHVSELQIEAEGVDFDMAYEKHPKQLVLKSYYDHCSISDGVIRNPQLNCRIAPESRLFRKYAVIHINYTDMPYRNIYGVEWNEIARTLQSEGYEVVQIGDDREKCGTWVNTRDIQTLMYVIGGADLFIGSDSGPAHIAMASGIPSILFFGSVNPRCRIANFDKIKIIQGACPAAGCYHETIGVRGTECKLGDEVPRCSIHTTQSVKQAIDHLIFDHIEVDWEKMKITFPGVPGNAQVYMDVMESLCGPMQRVSMIDLGCNLAPYTPLLRFHKRKYVDILPRVLDHSEEQKYFVQQDILKVSKNEHYGTSIASDVIEHLTEENGWDLLSLMEDISDRQIIFTPDADTFGWDYITDDPEHHRSLWTPEQIVGYATVHFPNYHPTLNAGSFFAWNCSKLAPFDFHRVVQELKHKSLSWPRL